MNSLSLLLLLIISLVSAQYPATIYTPVNKTLSISDTPLTFQYLPPCSYVDYIVTNPTFYSVTNNLTSANILFLEFIPSANSTLGISLPNDNVAIELLWRIGFSGNLSPIVPTYQFISTINSISYGGCVQNGAVIEDKDNNCGFGYWCSNLRQLAGISNLQLVVRVTTTDSEQSNGIQFSLRLAQRIIQVTNINYNVAYNVTATSPSPSGPNEPLFPPQFGQLDYYVNLVPKGSDRLSVANYIATTSNIVELSYKIYNFLIGGNAFSTNYNWSLTVNELDLAVTNPVVGCGTRNSSTSINSTSYLEIRVNACSTRYKNSFISIGIPSLTGTSKWTFTLSVSYVAASRASISGLPQIEEKYVPSFTQITSNNTLIPSIVGEGYDGYNYYGFPYQSDNYWLNIVSPAPDSRTYVFVTIFGINPHEITSAIYVNQTGYREACTKYDDFIDSCANHYQNTPHNDVPDFCKMQITPCQYSSVNYYFVSVTGVKLKYGDTFSSYYSGIDSSTGKTSFNLPFTYSILAQLFVINPIQINSLTSTINNGFTTYTDINYVAQMNYNHYQLTIDPSTITNLHYLIAQVYSNAEQTGIIIYYNQGSYAGSETGKSTFTYPYFELNPKSHYYNNDYYDPVDNCFNFQDSCSTSPPPNYDSPSKSFGTCSLVLPYCNILTGNLYFSVYGDYTPGIYHKSDLNFMGYNRSVSYTVNFSIRSTAEQLYYSVTNVQHMPKLNYFRETVQSHQFLLAIPSPDEVLFDQVRVRLHGFQKRCDPNEYFTMYAQCAQPTGYCPCYTHEINCHLFSSHSKYCTLQLDTCSCSGNNYYITVTSTKQAAHPCEQPVTYQITPFMNVIQITEDIVPSDLSTTQDTTLVFTSTLYTPIPYQQYYLDSINTKYIGLHYYRIINTDPSTNDALFINVKTASINVLDYSISPALTLSFNNPSCTISDCNPQIFTGSQGSNSDYYYYKSTIQFNDVISNYCFLEVNDCNYVPGTYYVRVDAVGVTDFNIYGQRAISTQTLDYTLEITHHYYNATVLTLNAPLRQYITLHTYNHYQFPVSSIPPNSWFRVSVYLNEETNQPVKFFMNQNSFAGDSSCYDYLYECRFGRQINNYTSEEYYNARFYENYEKTYYCDFFMQACDIPSTGTLYYSLATNTYPYPFIPATPVEYTIIAESQSVFSLDSGLPVTGLVLYDQVQYYSYTVTSSDYRPFVLQVQSIEPIVTYAVLEISVSSSPVSGGNGTCTCNSYFYNNAFSTITHNCGDLSSGTYYVTVRGIYEDSAYYPVTYTIRAFHHNRYAGSLALQTGVDYTTAKFTQVQPLLNYHEIIDYSITVSNLNNTVLYFGISDVSFTNTSLHSDRHYITAYLNYGTPGGPSCSIQSAKILNKYLQNPQGQLMYAFQITECLTGCSGTFYLSIYAHFDEPQPTATNQFLMNFTVAAWTVPISVPNNFATSNFRNNATQSGGYTYSFNQTNQIYCNANYTSSPFFIDYFFVTPSLLTNLYEQLKITLPKSGASNTNVGINPGSVSDLRSSKCNYILGTYTYGCSSSINTIYYGAYGYSSCSSIQYTNATGFDINFEIFNDKVYSQLSSISVNAASTTSYTVTIGSYQFVDFIINFNSVDNTTWSEFQLSFSGANSNSGACLSYGSTGISFPPGSYCPTTCADFNSINLLPCCYDKTDIYTVTVYNYDTSSMVATITPSLTAYASSGENLISFGFSSSNNTITTNGTLYTFLRFVLSPSNWNYDDVLNVQLVSSGSSTLYLSYATHSGDGTVLSSCLPKYEYTCNSDCLVQIPQCGPLQYGYGTYYLTILSTSSSITTSNLAIYTQQTQFFTLSTTGTVPEISGATDFYTHRKFYFIRNFGDVGLTYQQNQYQVQLTSSESLNIYIYNPFYNNPSNIYSNSFSLAGDSNHQTIGSPSYTSCDLNGIDSEWSCTSTTSSGTTTTTCGVLLCGSSSSYTNILPAANYVYLSVRNSNPTTPASFTINNLGVVSTATDNTVAIYNITVINNPTDTLFNTSCSSSSLSGGCHYTYTSPVTTAYFYIPIVPSNWGIRDYLLINVTDIQSGTYNIAVFSNDVCEPALTYHDATCTKGEECIFSTDSIFTSMFDGENGNNQRVSPYPLAYYVRITNIDKNSDFQFQARQVSPISVVQTLSRSVSSYSATYIMWNFRYLLFNIITPTTGDYELVVTGTSYCTSTPPILSYNVDNYRWSSNTTYEEYEKLDPTATLSFSSCDLENGGNNYFAIITALDATYNPQVQIRVSFSATLNFYNIIQIPWLCSINLPVSSSNTLYANYFVVADSENPGTQVAFALSNCNGCFIRVTSPLYRSKFTYSTTNYDEISTSQVLTSQTVYNYQYIEGTNSYPSSCDSISDCSATGVYCSNNLLIEIPPCEFANGRYFITVAIPKENNGAELTTYLDRKDFALLTLNATNYRASLTSTIRQGFIFFSYDYAQYYMFNIQTSAEYFVHVQIILDKDLPSYATLNGYLGFDPAFCSNIMICNTKTVSPCILNQKFTHIPDSPMYAMVEIDSNNINCGAISYILNAEIRNDESLDILYNNVPVCGEYDNYDNNNYFGYFFNFDKFYPLATRFYIIDPSLNLQFSTVTVGLLLLDNNPNNYYVYGMLNTYLSPKYASHYGCFLSSGNPPLNKKFDVKSSGSSATQTCGFGNGPLYVSVGGNKGENNYYKARYQVSVSVIQRPIVSLSSNNPNVTVTSSTTYTYNNNGTSQSVIYFDNSSTGVRMVTFSDTLTINTHTSCTDGCSYTPDYNKCIYFSQPSTYYFLVDYQPSTTTTCTGTIVQPQIFSLQTYNLINLPTDSIVYTLESGQILFFIYKFTSNQQISGGEYNVRITNLNNGDLLVAYGCNGVSTYGGTSCPYHNGQFSAPSEFQSGFTQYNCDCSALYISVKQTSTCISSPLTEFSITVDVNTPFKSSVSGTALTSTWQTGSIPRYAQYINVVSSNWTITSTTDGFIHVGVGNVNGSIPASTPYEYSGHTVTVTLYDNGCPVAYCMSAINPNGKPTRNNQYDSSCFIYYQTSVPGKLYIVSVTASQGIMSLYTGIFFRIQGINSFTDITTSPSSSTIFQIQGNSQNYYKLSAFSVGLPQSVTIKLSKLDGPKLNMIASTNPLYLFQANTFTGWSMTKTCPFGVCTFEIPTYASHPMEPVIYLWITTFSTNLTSIPSSEDAPTNYQLSTYLGLGNCGSLSSIVGTNSFCSNATGTSSSYGYWIPRDANTTSMRLSEASCRYDGFLCRCPAPTYQCQLELTRFSCLESFRECDSQGFWVAKCRSECLQVESVCGPFASNMPLYQGSSCNCQASQYDCSSSQYLDTEPCTGNSVIPAPLSGAANGPTPPLPNAPEPSDSPASDSAACNAGRILPSTSPIVKKKIQVQGDLSSSSTISASFVILLFIVMIALI